MYTTDLTYQALVTRPSKWRLFLAGFVVGISSLILLFILLFNLLKANSYQSYPPAETLISPTSVEDGSNVHTI